MAIEANLDRSLLPHDETAEEALECAIAAWTSMRARFATVDPTRLSSAGRAAYYRVLGRIGLWSDARVTASDNDPVDDDESADDSAPDTSETH